MYGPLSVPGVRDLIDALARRCQSDLGEKTARALRRASDREEAEERLDQLVDWTAWSASDAQPPLVPRVDFEQALSQASRGAVLGGEELQPLGQMLWCACQLQQSASAHTWKSASLRSTLLEMPSLRALALDLVDAFDQGGELLDDASSELRRLRDLARDRAGGLRRSIERLMRSNDEQGLLQDDYWTVRNGRYVLPVKASDKREIEGIVHGSSQTGQTVYLEPTTLVKANNDLAVTHEEIKREEHRILRVFTDEVGRHAADIGAISRCLAHVDTLAASVSLARELSATRPRFGKELALHQVRHPLLVLSGAKVVPNDVVLRGPNRWLVLSGPNGGGKTVALTTTGLAVEMAAYGLFVCAAPDSSIPWVAETQCVIGDAQDLSAGLSTFAGHIQRLQGVFARAEVRHTPDEAPCLVLLDELAAGTEPSAGAALARAVLEQLAAHETLGIATTHYEGVKLLAFTDDRFANCALAQRDGAPTYRVEPGTVGTSSPLALAKRIGLAGAVLERASELMGTGGQEVEQALTSLREHERRLKRQLDEATQATRRAEEARERLQQQREHERRAAEKRISKLASAAIETLEEAISKARDLQKSWSEQPPSGQLLAKQSKRLAAQLKQARGHQQRQAAGPAQSASPSLKVEELTVGATVWHSGLNATAQVIEIHRGRGELKVSVGGLELRCGIRDVRAAAAAPKRAKTPNSRHEIAVDDHDARGFATLDLRGLRVDEALSEVDGRLDRAVVADERGVCVVHGIGTGALRRSVSAHLVGHPQVQRTQLDEASGGGATFVWLKR